MAFIFSWIISLIYALFNWLGIAGSPEYDVIVVGYVASENVTYQAKWMIVACGYNANYSLSGETFCSTVLGKRPLVCDI